MSRASASGSVLRTRDALRTVNPTYLVVLVIVAGTLVASSAPSPGAAVGIAPTTAVKLAGGSPAAQRTVAADSVRTLYGHPLSTAGALGGPPAIEPARGASGALAPLTTRPVCDPTVTGTSGPMPVNYTLNLTPAAPSAPGPVNLSWNFTVYGGGLPPYHDSAEISLLAFLGNPKSTVYVNGSTGNVTLTTPGVYYLTFEVEDSSCTQAAVAETLFQVTNSAFGTLLIPATAEVAGANVTYRVNTTALPANYTTYWSPSPPPYYSIYYPLNTNSTQNMSYYFPGVYNWTAMFVEPNGTMYGFVTTPNVVVPGPSPVAFAYRDAPTNVSGITQVTLWTNVTNRSALPPSFTLELSVFDIARPQSYDINVTYAGGGSTWLNTTVPCGLAGTYYAYTPDPSGNCTFSMGVLLSVPGAPMPESLSVPFNVSATGTPSSWYLVLTDAYSAVTSNASGNLSVNFSLTGGTGGDMFSAELYGVSSLLPNGTFLPTQNWSSTHWNGSLTTLRAPLNATGIYWFEAWMSDSVGTIVVFQLPLITVGVTLPTHFAPLHVLAKTVNPGSDGANGTGRNVTFSVAVTGGTGPFDIQWNFGDGSFGTSLPGANVTHDYTVPGEYTPSVSVTDGAGTTTTTFLASVQVTAPSSTPTTSSGPSPGTTSLPPFIPPTQPTPSRGGGPSRGQSPSPKLASPPAGVSWTYLLAAAFVAVLSLTAALGVVRHQLRREGEALISGVETRPPRRP